MVRDKIEAEVTPEQLTDVRFYMTKLAEITRQTLIGDIPAVDAQRKQAFLADLFENINGVALKTASQGLRDPIERLADDSILELEEGMINKVEAAIRAIPGLDIPKKKRWIRLIERARAIQALAKKSAIAMWTYVGRNTENGEVFHMQTIQSRFFNVWNDTTKPNSLIMAPPAHSKTTCLRGQVIWDIANDPTLRILILYDTDDKSKKEIGVLKTLMRGKYFRALYPEVRVLGRQDDAEDSRRRFTVLRPNTGSREPTVEGAAIMSQINGCGYEYIYVDDPCPAMVANQPTTRDNINFKWTNVVEERLRNPERSRIRMICTPWHMNDLAGHIQRQVQEGARDDWLIAIDEFRIKDDLEGNPIPLWPQRFDSNYYRNKRLKMSPNEYARNYQLMCHGEEDQLVSKLKFYASEGLSEQFQQQHPEHVEAHLARLEAIRKGELWLSIDPSATSGRNSSETGVSEIVITAGGQAYCTDCHFFPGNPVVMQEWIVQRIAGGGIRYVLVEAQGGMKGMVSCWREYITRRLRELKVNWTGSIIDVKTQGSGGGQNIGKRQRLKNVAGYIQNGYIKFAGRQVWDIGIKAYDYRCSRNDRMQKLCNQILHFPMGTSDGVDTITQFLIFNESRLVLEGEQAGPVENLGEYENTMRTGMAAAMASLRQPKQSDSQEEDQWMSSRF